MRHILRCTILAAFTLTASCGGECDTSADCGDGRSCVDGDCVAGSANLDPGSDPGSTDDEDDTGGGDWDADGGGDEDVDTGEQADGECCSDPGAIAECWWQDAAKDGVACNLQNPCPSGLDCDYTSTGPSGDGLCRCESAGDCDDGNKMVGVCNTARGVCGPSYCNGYRACSCFGGCEDVLIKGHDTPAKHCASLPDSPHCCEREYPLFPGTDRTGECSSDATCESPSQALHGWTR